MLKQRTWVLLRGLGRETGHWHDFPQKLQVGFPQDEVIMLDLPGAGEYRDVRPPLTISGFVDFLKEKLIDKNPSHPIHLIAVSLGGMVALEWMRQYPMSIHASVLINTSLSGVSPFYQRLRWENYPRFFSTVMLQDAEQREKSLLNILSNRRDQHEHIALEWAQVNEQRPVKGRNVLQQLIAASHFKIEESVPVPTLLMVGLGDRLVNPQCSEDIHNKFDYPLVKHPWGGHDLTVDDAPWVVAEIKKWLATL